MSMSPQRKRGQNQSRLSVIKCSPARRLMPRRVASASTDVTGSSHSLRLELRQAQQLPLPPRGGCGHAALRGKTGWLRLRRPCKVEVRERQVGLLRSVHLGGVGEGSAERRHQRLQGGAQLVLLARPRHLQRGVPPSIVGGTRGLKLAQAHERHARRITRRRDRNVHQRRGPALYADGAHALAAHAQPQLRRSRLAHRLHRGGCRAQATHGLTAPRRLLRLLRVRRDQYDRVLDDGFVAGGVEGAHGPPTHRKKPHAALSIGRRGEGEGRLPLALSTRLCLAEDLQELRPQRVRLPQALSLSLRRRSTHPLW
mmetsp:Transcript_8381/g.16837  ORF Transcript_8381/g.16837 Transcript_8381/m.16837 type:complete len:312 (+) Transcript_8381:45-980(+)